MNRWRQYGSPGAADFSPSQSLLRTSFQTKELFTLLASQPHLVRNLLCLAPEMNNIIQLGTSNFLLRLWGKTVSFSSTVEFLPRGLHHPLASSYGSSKRSAGRAKPVDIPAVSQTLSYVLVLKQLLLFRARYFCELSPSKLQYMKYVHRARVHLDNLLWLVVSKESENIDNILKENRKKLGSSILNLINIVFSRLSSVL